MPECGAKLRKKDAHCRMSAMKNGRCRLHGGLSTGAKNPAKPTARHNIYDAGMTDEDRAFLETIKLGQVDDELEVVRVQLNRGLSLKKKFDENPYDPALQHIVKIVQERKPVKHADGSPMLDDMGQPVFEMVEVSREFGVPNFDDRVYRWTTRIESLEKTRKELAGSLGSSTPEETARALKDALDAIDDSIPDTGSSE
jgi:hypothetical protein